MKKLILLTLFILPGLANAQFDKIWEVQHAVGNDSLEILFNKKDSAGNLYVGGIIGNSYFVTKFNSIGQHQWTRGNNEFIQQLLFPPSSNFEQSVKTSWVSDIAFLDDDLFISGTKCIAQNSCYNFLLKIDQNGDSLGFIHVLKPDTAASFIWVPAFSVEPYPKSLLTILDGHIFYFTSLFAQTPEIGNVNVNIFRFSESLGLLKRRPINGIRASSMDRIISVENLDNNFLIHTLVGALPRTLFCDSSLSVSWEKVQSTLSTARHSVLTPIPSQTYIHTFSNFRDTSKKDYQSGLLYKSIGHIKRYDYNGNLSDSLLLFKSGTSNDSLTDACIDDLGNIYTVSISRDSGNLHVLLCKIDTEYNFERRVLLGINPKGGARVRFDGCVIYVSFTEDVISENGIKLIRLDRQLNILSEDIFANGQGMLIGLSMKDKGLLIFSQVRGGLSDTLKISKLSDTTHISNPISLTANAIAPRLIHLNWQFSAGLLDSAILYRSIDSSNWQQVKVVPAIVTSYYDSNTAPSSRYFYSIVGKWGNEFSCNNLYVSDSTPFNTGLPIIESDFYQLYPNPVQTNLFIESDFDITEVEVKTVTGKVVATYISPTHIPFNELPAGIYFIQINKTYTYKILKL